MKKITLCLLLGAVCLFAACGEPNGAEIPTVAPTVTATPEPTATLKPTSTPEPTSTATPTPEATATPTPEATATPTPEATATSTPEATATPTPEATATPTPEPTATPTPEPTATPTPEATATPIPTATPQPTATPKPIATPTPTPSPEPEEPGTAYAVTGPNGEAFKIYVDDSGKMLAQRYYDAAGVLLGRNVVYYDMQGRVSGMECYNANQEYIGIVYLGYFSDGSYEVAAKAEATGVVAAYSLEIGSDGLVEANFVQADRRTMMMYQYVQDGTLLYYGIMNYDEEGKELSAIAYDTAGTVIEEITYEYREDGSYKEEYYSYIATGNMHSHSIDEYDSHGNNTYSVDYDAEGAISNETTTEWEYYANGSVKQYTRTYNSAGSKIVEHKVYDEQGVCVKETRFDYNIEGNCTYGSEREYYSNGKRKDSDYGKYGIQSVTKYNEQGVQAESTWYNYNWETGILEGYRVSLYNDSGKIILLSNYDAAGELLSQEAYEYDAAGTRTCTYYYNGDGSLKEKETYETVEEGTKTTTYNSMGLLTNIRIRNSERKYVYTDSYTYDKEGRLTYRLEAFYAVNEGDKDISTQYYYIDGQLAWYETEESDPNTSESEWWYYEGDGTLERHVYYEVDEDGKRWTVAEYGDGTLNKSRKQKKTDGSEGKEEITYFYNKDKVLTGYMITEYNAEGYIIGGTEYDAEGNVITP